MKAPDPHRLAIFGGPPALHRLPRDRWRKVPLRALRSILYAGLRDVNTVSDGRGAIARFERHFAERCGTKHALVMNSGTASLHSAYFALGVGPGTEVIVPAYTFYASLTPVLQLGGVPVFCDIDPKTLTADPEDVERRITPRTRAICAVHVWGNPARMDALLDVARRHGVALVEDASHAPGARYRGRPVGSWGDIGCFSLQGAKAVSGGETGIAVTDEALLFDRMLALGHGGRTGSGQVAATFPLDTLSLGVKYRAHLYGVLLATIGLERLPELNRLRRRRYAILEEELASCDALRPVGTYDDAERGGFLSFLLEYRPDLCGGWSREAFVHAARAERIPLSVDRYGQFAETWSLLPDAPLLRSLDASGLGGVVGSALSAYRRNPPPEVPVAREIARRLVSLPAFARVPEAEVRTCARALRKVVRGVREIGDLRELGWKRENG